MGLCWLVVWRGVEVRLQPFPGFCSLLTGFVTILHLNLKATPAAARLALPSSSFVIGCIVRQQDKENIA